MTKHNIKDHLDWLIKAGSFHPSQPLYAPPTAEIDSTLVASSDIFSTQEPTGNTCKNSNDNLGILQDVDRPLSQPEFARPSIPASILNARDGVMARLQSGSKSNHKPRLLSENLPLSLQTPATSSTKGFGTSLKDRYNARWEQRAAGIHSRVSLEAKRLTWYRLGSTIRET